MKKLLLLLPVSILFCGLVSVKAQTTETPQRKCGTMEYLQQQINEDPSIPQKMDAFEQATQEWIANNQDEVNSGKVVVTVPVVVHIVYSNTAYNISDARVAEQIAVLNADYGGLNTHSMEAFSTSLKTNTELQFCLAKRTPAGVSSTGIERRGTAGVDASFSTDNQIKYYSQGGLDSWNPQKYINIWVGNLSGYLCGYAQFPGSGINATFGVVIHYQYFGKTGAVAPYNLGGTTTHEIGHCFNLRHIWGDDGGACSGTDYCADTPNQADATYGAHSGVLTDACSTTSPGIMYMNFMDYSDDIDYANFTPNQKSRIQALFSGSGALYSLTTSNGCTPVGIEEGVYIQDVNIFPNPTSGELSVNFNLANPDNVVVSVYNMMGEEIVSYSKENASVVNTTIDLSKCATGVYFVKIISTNQTLTEKISLIR